MRGVAIERARRLLTIENMSWPITAEWVGAIIRFAPPPDATESEVEEMVARAREAGAVSVRVLPWRRAAVVPAQAAETPAPRRESVREAATALVEESAYEDRDALWRTVDEMLSAEGL